MNQKGLSPVVVAVIMVSITVIISIAVAAWLGALTFTFNEVKEKECFRSVEWFPTISEALNWSLNKAPERVTSLSQFIYYNSGVTVTRHEIIVKPSDDFSFGYDVTIIFYGIKED